MNNLLIDLVNQQAHNNGMPRRACYTPLLLTAPQWLDLAIFIRQEPRGLPIREVGY